MDLLWPTKTYRSCRIREHLPLGFGVAFGVVYPEEVETQDRLPAWLSQIMLYIVCNFETHTDGPDLLIEVRLKPVDPVVEDLAIRGSTPVSNQRP